MFLLILEVKDIAAVVPNFTFQYVSINTVCGVTPDSYIKSLHSNMFLLILAVTSKLADQIFFTFQYVSINTMVLVPLMKFSVILYIPICFY